MKRFLIAGAALALLVGSAPALAQARQPAGQPAAASAGAPPENAARPSLANTPDAGFARYQRTVVSPQKYDAGPFEAPDGYTYKHYAVGDRLQNVLLDDDSLLLSTSYDQYGLAPPPAGLEWMRVGSDALLFNPGTGVVIEADYSLFE